jgi:nicotinamidase-related amidase
VTRLCLIDEKKTRTLQALYVDTGKSIQDILSTLHVSKAALYRRRKNSRHLPIGSQQLAGNGATQSGCRTTDRVTRVLTLPLRWWSDQNIYKEQSFQLDPDKTAFALLDCDGTDGPASYDYSVKAKAIAPALGAARRAGIKVIYFHNAPGGEGGTANVNRELHGIREGKERPSQSGWKPIRPPYEEFLASLPNEAEFQKANRNWFRDTFADQYLRTWQIETLIFVGFSLKSCLYHTCVGAQEHNYRAVVLRDFVCPPGTKEYPDTLDVSNPEGGWMRFVVLRLIETNIVYTATSQAFAQACRALEAENS